MSKASVIRAYTNHCHWVRTRLDRLTAYPESALHASPGAGKWTMLQILEHLCRSEELSLQYLRKKLSSGTSGLQRSGPGAWFRGWLISWYLEVPVKFKAPKMVDVSHDPGAPDLASARARWEKIMADWLLFLDQQPEEVFDFAVYKHPLGGRIGWMATIRFFTQHTRRHFRNAPLDTKNYA
jgi:hypothetical protein